MADFKNDLRVGGIGERVFWDLMSHSDNVRNVIDLRFDKRFRENDVDFMVETNDRQFYYVEVKSDTRMAETGNIVYEKYTTTNVGCWDKTTADFMYYYDTVSEIMYVISMKALRDYIGKMTFNLLRISGDTEGYLIPIEELIDKKVVKSIKKLKEE